MGRDFELEAGTGSFDLELGWDLKTGARSGGWDTGIRGRVKELEVEYKVYLLGNGLYN